MSALERIGLSAMRSLFGERAVEVTPGVVAFRTPEAPDSPMVNRVWGLGLERPATEEDLDAALAAMGDAVFYVAVTPEALPTELPSWLAARGFEPGWGWMQFERGPEEPPPMHTELDVVEIGVAEADVFAHLQRVTYGLPEAVEPWIRTLPGLPGWICWLAYSHGEAAAGGAQFVDGESCYFGFAATLPEHRGKGGQSAMLATRIDHARERGCTLLVTETGEQLADRPSDSYRNLLRAGFRERYVVQNWRRA